MYTILPNICNHIDMIQIPSGNQTWQWEIPINPHPRYIHIQSYIYIHTHIYIYIHIMKLKISSENHIQMTISGRKPCLKRPEVAVQHGCDFQLG